MRDSTGESRKKRVISILAVLLLLGLGGAFVGWYKLFREVSIRYQSEEDHFKYGSVGTERPQGIPYYIWKILPSLFPDKLPGSSEYASFGFLFEEGHDTPIGLPRKTVGFPRLGINCALCHTATYRVAPSDSPKIILGAPSTTLDLGRYLDFLTACAADPRFTAENVLGEITKTEQLSLLDRGLYRFLIIPQTKKALLKQKEDLAWMKEHGRPLNGPGRVDPFNPAKFAILKLPDDGSIGNSDMVPLWNWKSRERFALHWDGLNTSLTEVFLNSGIGNGADKNSIDIAGLKRLQEYVTRLDPPKYPFDVDQRLAVQGGGIFQAQCASCHSFAGNKTGQPLPVSEVGTDEFRLASWTKEAADKFNGLTIYPWRYTHFRKTDGYVSVALDGIWIRAPYLHNGSVPSLTDLLMPVEGRPKKFLRGYDVYDPVKIGFVSEGAEAQRVGFEYDTSLPGNSNQGHTFGTQLPPDEKQALIEFLKTL
jgi:mono/diheme cytochrome c family protein